MDSPSNLVMAVKTTVRAGMLRPMAKVSVAKSTCTVPAPSILDSGVANA